MYIWNGCLPHGSYDGNERSQKDSDCADSERIASVYKNHGIKLVHCGHNAPQLARFVRVMYEG